MHADPQADDNEGMHAHSACIAIGAFIPPARTPNTSIHQGHHQYAYLSTAGLATASNTSACWAPMPISPLKANSWCLSLACIPPCAIAAPPCSSMYVSGTSKTTLPFWGWNCIHPLGVRVGRTRQNTKIWPSSARGRSPSIAEALDLGVWSAMLSPSPEDMLDAKQSRIEIARGNTRVQ